MTHDKKIRNAYSKSDWAVVQKIANFKSVRYPKTPNLEILAMIVVSLGKNITTDKYSKMSYKELKEEAVMRDLASTGKKVDIIARIIKNDEKYITKPGEIMVNCRAAISGSWYSIKIDRNKTGLELKKALSEKSNIPTINQRLYIITNGINDLLKDDKSLVDQNMYAEAFCRIEIKMRR